MSRRVLLIHMGLFFVAYGAFLAHHWSSHSATAVISLSQYRERVDDWRPGDRYRDTPRAPASQNPSPVPRVQPAENADVTEQVTPATPLTETGGPTPETVAEVESLSAQALGAADPRDRAKAITQLRNLAKTPASLQALTQVLAADVVVQNRLFAISALADLWEQGDEDGSIAAALRHAALDADPKVAARAHDAYASKMDPAVAVE